MRDAQEVEFQVDGLTLKGKLWVGEGEPILAIHGWLDNAASFDALAQALPSRTMLALDLAGHGHSDHKPPSGSYAIWDDLRSLKGVLDQLQWASCVVIGHSRGAMISSLLASSLAERITKLVCLDGFIAQPADESEAARQIRGYVQDFTRQPSAPRAYGSVEELIRVRQRGMEIAPEQARLIILRGVYQHSGKYFWRSDRRLHGASPLKLTLKQWQSVVDALTMPVLLVLAKDDYARFLKTLSLNLPNAVEVMEVEGNHHCHMQPEFAAAIAAAL